MKVFLTGASGFVGAHVARVLLAAGCRVAALVRPGRSLWRLADSADRLTLIPGDLADLPGVRPVLAEWRPEACIHLAWYAEPGKYLHSLENLAALTASLRFLEELIQIGCHRIVMVGTCAEYDTDLGFLREDSPTRPTTIYAAAKLALNLVGQQVSQSLGGTFAWARLFYLYGPLEDPRRVVPALIRALRRGEPFPATAGEQVRDYLYIEDVAAALWILAERRGHGVFNIASGMPVTMRQFMETVGAITGKSHLIRFGAVPYRDWDPMFICGDNRRLREIGWSPRYSLTEGLEQTVKYWERTGPGDNPAGL